MTIYRIRVEVVDERGRLGRLASAIANCGGNILGVDVHLLDGARVADEFTVEYQDGGSADALAAALRRADGVTVDVQRLDDRHVVDPVARAVDVAARLFAGPSPDVGLVKAAATLVRADTARFVDEGGEDVAPVVEPAAAGGWRLTLPDPRRPTRRWLLLERASPCFSSSEVARVAALVRLAGAATTEPGPTPRQPALPRPLPLPRRPAAFFRTRPPHPAGTGRTQV